MLIGKAALEQIGKRSRLELGLREKIGRPNGGEPFRVCGLVIIGGCGERRR